MLVSSHLITDQQVPAGPAGIDSLPKGLRWIAHSLDHLPDHIAILDGQGHIIAVNSAWCRFAQRNDLRLPNCGLDANYLRICEQARGDDAESARIVGEALRGLLQTGEGEFSCQYPCTGPQVQEWFQLCARSFLEGQDHFVVLSHHAITDLVQTRDTLERAQTDLERQVEVRTRRLQEAISELQQFSYSMAHDMRAPLRAMHGFATILLRECEGCPERHRADLHRRIIASAERLDHLIRDVLDYARVIQSDWPVARVNLHRLLLDLTESYPELIPFRGDIRITPPIPDVMGNEAALTQCFANLLRNAVKFVPRGVVPDVCVFAEDLPQIARISVQDNGIGIPPEVQPKLFRTFSRLSDPGEGVGIGLAIVAKTVDRLGGRVGVDSEPGKGSRFWVELPRACPQ
jgi:signal transduction histidine kinase